MYLPAASTSSVCSDNTYGGEYAFEAYETSFLRDVILNDISNVFAFFSIHCFSEYLLLPYGYTAVKPENFNQLVSPTYIPCCQNLHRNPMKKRLN